MKTDYRHQEILLLTNTSFSGKAWLTKNELKESNQLSQKEQLSQACWNGLLPEIMPEFFANIFDKSLILWEVNEANAFIALEYGEFIRSPEKNCSVNPYVFMDIQNYN